MKKPAVFTKRFWKLVPPMAGSVVEAFRFTNPTINGLIRLIFAPLIYRVTYVAYNFSRETEEDGNMQRASKTMAKVFTRDLRVHGAEKIPLSDPILFVGNHSGIGDALSVYASSPRTDIHTLAFNNGMLPGLPDVQPLLIILDKENPTSALKKSVRHLKAGKSLLMFPYGEIEQDPSLNVEDAIASLSGWSESINFFVKHVPNLQIVPFAVGGVVSRKALGNWIVRQYKDRNNRHFLALTFQLIMRRYNEPIVSLFFGDVLTQKSATLQNVQNQMETILRAVHTEQMQLIADGYIPEYTH